VAKKRLGEDGKTMNRSAFWWSAKPAVRAKTMTHEARQTTSEPCGPRPVLA